MGQFVKKTVTAAVQVAKTTYAKMQGALHWAFSAMQNTNFAALVFAKHWKGAVSPRTIIAPRMTIAAVT